MGCAIRKFFVEPNKEIDALTRVNLCKRMVDVKKVKNNVHLCKITSRTSGLDHV